MNPKALIFVTTFGLMFQEWAARVTRGKFADPISGRPLEEKEFFIDGIRRDLSILERMAAQGPLITMPQQDISPVQDPSAGVLAAFRKSDGPGTLSSEGPRHSNGEYSCVYLWLSEDHADISSIKVAPTPDELICSRVSYLPPNDMSVHHLHQSDGMSKL